MNLAEDIEHALAIYANKEAKRLDFPPEWDCEFKDMLEAAVLCGMNLITAYQHSQSEPPTPQQLRKVITQVANKRGWDQAQLLNDG